MILEFALLGFLNKGPGTGYELQKKIGQSINHFWTSTQSQIYRTLRKMEKDNLIESKIHFQDDRPNKKIYSITEKGKKGLFDWLSSPIDIPNHRNPFLVQLFFSGEIGRKSIISNLLRYKSEMEHRLQFLKSPEATQLTKSGSSNTELFIYQALVDNGICLLQSEIDWIDRTLHKTESLEGERMI